MSDESPPILIASDLPHDAEVIARDLDAEFAHVHQSTDPKRCAHDFALYKPAVLILAFDSLEKSERYFQKLRQPSVMARVLPHRVLILCSSDDLHGVYELCRKNHFDDFVLFWPRTDETRPLRMAVRRALREVLAVRCGVPGAGDFAAPARRLAALAPLLEERALAAQAAGAPPEAAATPWREPVRALRLLAERHPPRVLVIDDDRFQHKLLGQMLAEASVQLAFATSVTQAIVDLHKRRPDLILMDVGLPDVNGIEATRLLKSAPHFAAIPVIMITGVGGKNAVVESLNAGASDFVVKPVDKNVLLGKVSKLLFG